MKEIYEAPELEIIRFEAMDIITLSDPDDIETDIDEW